MLCLASASAPAFAFTLAFASAFAFVSLCLGAGLRLGLGLGVGIVLAFGGACRGVEVIPNIRRVPPLSLPPSIRLFPAPIPSLASPAYVPLTLHAPHILVIIMIPDPPYIIPLPIGARGVAGCNLLV